MVTDKTVFEQVVALLSAGEAAFRVIEHPAEGRCEAVAALRGTEQGQGAKALVCQTRIDGTKHYILAVLAADRQADLQRLASELGGKKASLVSPAEITTLTACVPGRSRRSASTRSSDWSPIRSCLSATMKLRLTPAICNAPWCSMRRIICVLRRLSLFISRVRRRWRSEKKRGCSDELNNNAELPFTAGSAFLCYILCSEPLAERETEFDHQSPIPQRIRSMDVVNDRVQLCVVKSFRAL